MAVVATVVSDGAVHLAPRELVVHYDGRRTAICLASGELLWLETPEITAFRDGETSAITVLPRSEDELLLLPRDVGAEAKAMLNVEELLEWANCVGRVPQGPFAHNRITLDSPDGYHLQAALDPCTGFVLEAAGTGPGGELALRTTRLTAIEADEKAFLLEDSPDP